MTDRDDAHHDERQEARDPDHAPTRRERLYEDAPEPWEMAQEDYHDRMQALREERKRLRAHNYQGGPA